MDELKSILSRGEIGIPERDVERLLTEVDSNRDNVIDYNEFLEMMKNDLKV